MDYRNINLVERPIMKITKGVGLYRRFMDNLRDVRPQSSLLALDKGMEPMKRLGSHPAIEVVGSNGTKYWEATEGSDGYLHGRSGKWSDSQRVMIRRRMPHYVSNAKDLDIDDIGKF